MGRPIRGQQDAKPPDEAPGARALRRLELERAPFEGVLRHRRQDSIALLLRGGNLGVLGAPSKLIGLRQIPALLRRVIAHTPPGANRAASMSDVCRWATVRRSRCRR